MVLRANAFGKLQASLCPYAHSMCYLLVAIGTNSPVHFFVCFHGSDGTQQGGGRISSTNQMLERLFFVLSTFPLQATSSKFDIFGKKVFFLAIDCQM